MQLIGPLRNSRRHLFILRWRDRYLQWLRREAQQAWPGPGSLTAHMDTTCVCVYIRTHMHACGAITSRRELITSRDMRGNNDANQVLIGHFADCMLHICSVHSSACSVITRKSYLMEQDQQQHRLKLRKSYICQFRLRLSLPQSSLIRV